VQVHVCIMCLSFDGSVTVMTDCTLLIQLHSILIRHKLLNLLFLQGLQRHHVMISMMLTVLYYCSSQTGS